MISALLIPLLFSYYGNRKLNEPIPNVMDLGLPPKIAEENNNSSWSFEPLRNWNYKKIKVEPNKARENSDFYVSEFKKLQQENEKESGIEFVLGKDNTYGDFASVLNDFHIARHETYIIDIEKTGNLFAVVHYKDPNITEEKIECLLCNDVIV